MNSWDEKYRWYEYYYLNQNNFPVQNIPLNCIVSYTNNYDKYPIKPKEKAPMKNGWITAKNGDRKHYQNDRLHNDNGPAIEYTNGAKSYYKNGKLHREDGPAVDSDYGGYYYLNGKHLSKYTFDLRIEQRKKLEEKQVAATSTAPALEVKPVATNPYVNNKGTKIWYKDPETKDQYHRENGPVIENANGSKEWWQNGKLHRLNGPALMYSNGEGSYYINGAYYATAEKYWQAVSLIPQTDTWGNISYFTKDQALHRENGPAHITKGGDQCWYRNGKLHRLDGPAINSKYRKEYWIDNIRYDEEKYWEAVSKIPQTIGGDIFYMLRGRPHRLDGPAHISSSGVKEWYKNGNRHRLDGPAIENNSDSLLPLYWINGIGYQKEAFEKKVLELNGGTVTNSNTPVVDRETIMTKSNAANSGTDSMTGTPVTFLTKLQQNAKVAGPRILCKTISKGARAALIHLMKSKKMKKSWVRTVSEMMETEYGLAVVSFGLSLLFKYVPTLKDDPRAQYVADEFQIQSVETVGNELVEELMTFLLPAIMEYQEVRIEQPTNTRVESTLEEDEEEDLIDDSQIRKVA